MKSVLRKIIIGSNLLLCSILLMGQQMHLNWIESAGGVDWDMVSDMAIADDSSVVLTGTFYDNIAFGSDTLRSAGDRDIFVARFSDQGKYLSSFSFGTSGYDYSYKLLCEQNSSNIFLAFKAHFPFQIKGTEIDSLNRSNFVVANFTENGELLNHFVFATTEKSKFVDFCLAPDGDLYFTGYFRGVLYAGNDIYEASGQDIYVGKVSKQGKYKWLKHWGAEGNDQPFNLVKDKTGKLYLTGLTHAGCFGGKYPVPQLIERKDHMFLAQINDGGNIVDVSYILYGSDFEGKGIALNDTSVWLTAMFKYNVTTIENYTYYSKGKYDILLLNSPLKKIDFNIQQIGGYGSDIPIQIALSGNVLVFAGMYSGELYLNDIALEHETVGNDIFVSTINNKGEFDKVLTLSGENYDYSSVLKIFNAGVYVAGEFKEQLGIGEMAVVSSGREDIFVARFENCDAKNPLTLTVDSTLIKPGLYSYRISANEGFINYLWANNSTNSFIETQKAGLYFLEVEDNWGCFYLDSVSINGLKSVFLGEGSVQTGGMKFYPTYTQDKVNIIVENDIETASFILIVSDINGKIYSSVKMAGSMKSSEVYQVSLHGLSPGSYFVTVKTDVEVSTGKVLVY